jgi:hypothetical protein
MDILCTSLNIINFKKNPCGIVGLLYTSVLYILSVAIISLTICEARGANPGGALGKP